MQNDFMIIYAQIKKNGRVVEWNTTVLGKLYKAQSLKAVRKLVHADLERPNFMWRVDLGFDLPE
jgi:hypothetical protein